MFVDASAIVGILARAPDAVTLMARLAAAKGPVYVSPLSVYEAVFSLAKAKTPANTRPAPKTLATAETAVTEFLTAIAAKDVVVTMDIGRRAVAAGRQFGKIVGHSAQLNFGDCFAYACAKAYRLPLLFKGTDFTHTDITVA